MSTSRYPVEIPVRAGRLRFYVSIEQKLETQTPSGATTIVWTPYATNVAAEINYGGGRPKELFLADQEQHWVFATISIRYIPGVTTKMRANHNGKLYDIIAILLDPSQQSYLDLWCVEGLNQG